MHGQHIGYIRISPIDTKQLRQLENIPLDKSFEEIASSKDIERPVLQECLAYVREGDTLHVQSIDRICRNMKDLLHILNTMQEKKVCIRFYKEDIAFKCGESDSVSKNMLAIVSAVALFESELVKERRREGLVVAKQSGKILGRKPILTDCQMKEIAKRIIAGEKRDNLAKEFCVSRATIYNVLGNNKVKKFIEMMSTHGLTLK